MMIIVKIFHTAWLVYVHETIDMVWDFIVIRNTQDYAITIYKYHKSRHFHIFAVNNSYEISI